MVITQYMLAIVTEGKKIRVQFKSFTVQVSIQAVVDNN